MSTEISELNLSVVKNIGESILELKKSIETPESNGEQCNEKVTEAPVSCSIDKVFVGFACAVAKNSFNIRFGANAPSLPLFF